MIDICFGDSECGMLRFALKKDVLRGNILLDLGNIPLADFESARKKWMYSFFRCSKWKIAKSFREEKKSIQKILTRAKKGEEVRLWVASSPNSRCGYYRIIYLLQGICQKVFVVEMPENLGFRHNGEDKSWGEASPYEARDCLELQRELSIEERNDISAKWEKLAHENSELRINVNGEIESVPIDYLDDEILSYLPEKEIRFGDAIGFMLGRSMHSLSDGFIEDRIRVLIDSRKLIVVKEANNSKDYRSQTYLKKAI